MKTMFRNKSVVEIKSTDGRIRVVHMNRLRLNKIRPRSSSDQVQPLPNLTWEAPSFQHELLESDGAHSEQIYYETFFSQSIHLPRGSLVLKTCF